MEFDFSKEPGKIKEKENMVSMDGILPKLSIITPYYNSGAYFEQTYRCLMNQSLTEFEWIIINDGSTRQEDVELLEKLAKTDC